MCQNCRCNHSPEMTAKVTMTRAYLSALIQEACDVGAALYAPLPTTTTVERKILATARREYATQVALAVKP